MSVKNDGKTENQSENHALQDEDLEKVAGGGGIKKFVKNATHVRGRTSDAQKVAATITSMNITANLLKKD